MSEEINTRLFERAAEMIDYWESNLHARLIQQDLDRNDLEGLATHVRQAEDAQYQIEFRPFAYPNEGERDEHDCD